MRINQEVLIANGDASGNLTSLNGLLAHCMGYSIEAIITGTPVGQIKLQGSNDPVPNANFNALNFTVTNWLDILDTPKSITGSGIHVYNAMNAGYNWVRFVYTSTSGTGNITVNFNSKGA